MAEASDSAAAKLTGIVGSAAQVAGSLSPSIHNAAFNALEMDWEYRLFGMDSASAVKEIRNLVSGGVRGLNVTLPHKVLAMEAMDELSESASQIGALNTVEVRGDRLVGWNTDGEGLVRFLRMDVGAKLEGAAALVIGAGGSARAAVFALATAGAASVHVLARDQAKAAALVSLADGASFEAACLGRYSAERVEQADVIINATPVGQAGEQAAIDVALIRPDAVVVDMVYRPPVTPLIEGARSRGAIAHSGLGMLLHQAVLAFEIWTGVQPPIDVMSAAALAELKKNP
ncbi:MAG: shikimate dehydrogenase [Actinomycetota bacterium]